MSFFARIYLVFIFDMPVPSSILSEVLLKNKIIDNTKLTELENLSKENGADLYSLLINQNLIEKEKINRLLADKFGVNYINLEEIEIDKEMLKHIPEIVAKKNNVVIFKRDKKGTHIATDDPSDEQFLKNVEKRLDDDIIVYFSDQESIHSVIKEHYQTESEDFLKMINDLTDKDEVSVRAEDVPIIKIVDKLLILGHINQCSDIHIEPYEKQTLIRFRIDGILHDTIKIPKNLHELIVTRLKILSRLRTDEHRAAQDGKLKFNFEQDKVDVRISIVPVVYGEKVVMRLLSEKSNQHDLENLGLRKEDLAKIISNIEKPWGMILATGPTGSGKTTTLYGIIKKLNKREVNISTIEDPVEYDIEGISQIQVNPLTNLTFAAGLRSLVRQDPDIIMVGEIRDEETAKIAINSAMTGHLVLSTLHTNDASTTLPRLTDMGIEPFLVASTVNIAIAQRLVRVICETCKEKAVITEDQLFIVKKQLSTELIKKYDLDNPKLSLFHGRGCPICQNTGYKGRKGIYEILEMNSEIKQLVMDKANAERIKEKAVEHGMLPIIEDGVQKALAGITTINEILRVTKE